MATEVEIDDSLYSRQRYVLGDNAMQRMAKSNVLLCGLGGLGVEIAKNIILAGIKSLTVQDSKAATFIDLGTQFFLQEEHVKNQVNRAEASLSQLSELNPYVSVKVNTEPLDEVEDWSFLNQYQCVVVTEASLTTQLKINEYCRSQSPTIQFISADVYGVFCSVFCDFGDEFEVVDTNGEEAKECFIAKITKADPGVVTCLDNRMHGFETGDTVTFKEVEGMASLNNKSCQIKVLSPYAFSICDTTSDEFQAYERGGIATQKKLPRTLTFKSLDAQLNNPSLMTTDLGKLDAPANIHVGMLALHGFMDTHQRRPYARCDNDSFEILSLAKDINMAMHNKLEQLDQTLLRCLSYTSSGSLAPLCAALGGIVAQEALKALTGKFMPLSQWLHLDASELACVDSKTSSCFDPGENRYDALKACIGDQLLAKLAELRLFMVGCGAIGCEMLKNFALLGIGTTGKGQVTITDNDLIEKSNLNRQFLFRPHHIRNPKSTTAAKSAQSINSGMKIEAHQHKVCPQTEKTVYTDDFFENQDLVVNALDNIEARKYVDSRCVTNQRALLESGTMGAKGHVQVIVPHLTESYSNQRDPPDEDVPYCTLKSFPAVMDHCIQWARDKFESSFTQKPSMFNKFWTENVSPQDVIQKLNNCQSVEGGILVSKMSSNRPTSWNACVSLARHKFEKYFNHKAKHLLNAFPLDTKLQDGSLFWQSPKRPPNPVEFDASNDGHMLFIRSTAQLYADIAGIQFSQQDTSIDNLKSIISRIDVPPFRPTLKKIEVDESAKKPETEEIGDDELVQSARRLEVVCRLSQNAFVQMKPLSFEKDDDSNGHIDFITATSNLRAAMYSIESADRLKIKRIAGRIVPAIATTTATVSALATIELLKVVKRCGLDEYKNCFLNLALPLMLFSQPAPAETTVINEKLSFTDWDKWHVHGNRDFTLQQFLQHFKEKYGLAATMVVHGVKMIYVPVMPGHKKRLPNTMVKLLKPSPETQYVDLVVTLEGDPEDVSGPPVRYHFGL